jgi:hypothetical protein
MTSNENAPPPGGARPGRKRSATGLLNAALDEVQDGVTRLRAIIDTLIAQALKGEIAAIREIFERRDGRSPAALRNLDGPRKVLLRWKSEKPQSKETNQETGTKT